MIKENLESESLEAIKRKLSFRKYGKDTQKSDTKVPMEAAIQHDSETDKIEDGAKALAEVVKITLENAKVEMIPIDKLNKVEYYSRVGIDGRENVIKNSLTENGFAQAIIVNRRKNGKLYVIDGFQRCQVWKFMDNEEVPAFVLNVSEAQEKRMHIFFNQQEFTFIMEKIPKLEYSHFGLHAPDESPGNSKYHSESEEKTKKNQSEAIISKKFRIAKVDNDLFKEICEKLMAKKG
jgi:hypothetical protein